MTEPTPAPTAVDVLPLVDVDDERATFELEGRTHVISRATWDRLEQPAEVNVERRSQEG